MRVMITGASGFIGAYVVREAVARGHAVLALTRSGRAGTTAGQGRVEWQQCDLGTPGALDLRGRGIDAVIHLAAEMGGDAAAQQSTLTATRNLLAAMRAAGVCRLVGISSISVLDYLRIPPMAIIDEDLSAPPDGMPIGRYAAMKLAQERLLLAFAEEPGVHCVILRPGLVYDNERLIAAHAGILRGAWRLLVTHRGEVPTIEVTGLAKAILNAAELSTTGNGVIHLVDDNLPKQHEYLAGLRRRNLLPSGGIRVPWQLLAWFALLVKWPLRCVGRFVSVPDTLLPHSIAARMKPFRYSNDKAKRLLEWVPANQFH
ncbi:MAG: NAD-dependent epimerase/dehydratase family protein [Bacteroidota bacterium]